VIDWQSPTGLALSRRLEGDRHAWLTTVAASGTPYPSLIWFLRVGGEVIVYSQPETLKVRNIAARPRVSLHFDSDGNGGGVATLTGSATIDPAVAPAHHSVEYLARYEDWIVDDLGMTPEGFAASYSVPIRITLDGGRAF
jgi:PPOX class probable F420-dependent enzyme